METTTLTTLSPEVICLILEHVESGRDLYAFLRASSSIYRPFAASKDLILWNIAKNVMEPEVLVDAIIAVKLRNMECGFDGVWSSYEHISAHTRERLLGGDGKISRPQDWVTSADVSTLRQLQSAVEYFVNGFCSRSLPALSDHANGPSTGMIYARR